MTIRSLTDATASTARMLPREAPDAGFFQVYKIAYANYQAAATTATAGVPASGNAQTADRLLADLLGQVHTELSRRRGLGAEDQAAYAGILNRAYTQGCMLDLVGFLNSLSGADLAVIQRNHALVDPISPATLTREGAYNLLLPEGCAVDLDYDDMIEVGISRGIRFPPTDAPAAFVESWAEATRNMSEMDAATYSLVMFSAMHSVTLGGQPLRRTIDAESMDSYRGLITNFLDMLEHPIGELAPGQYERDKEFFTRLLALLD